MKAQATQMESKCRTCSGFGWVREQRDPTMSYKCGDCAGRGVVPVGCDWCGEDATRVVGKQPFCESCNRDDDEPRGDHPLNGMGYGIDYGPALEAARRLK